MSTDVNEQVDIRDGDSPDPNDAPEPTAVQPEVDPELARVTEERDGLRDRLLRVTAEFDNYRKRIDRERREATDRAAEGVLSDLLPILDDLERALAADVGDASAESYRRGVELIYKQILDLLTRRGVKPIEAVGQPFDPHLHQAVASEPVEGVPDGEIVEELRRGYLLGDRLLRPAMVKVAQA
jgi:molecular chaperone GrpE